MTKGKVQMFKTAHHPDFMNDYKLGAVDIAMATSAAPLYFPMAEVGNSNFIDGGVVANAPDLCAVHEAINFLDQKLEEITVLSIGTTTSKFSLPSSLGRFFGQRHWLENQRLASTVISSQQQLVDSMLRAIRAVRRAAVRGAGLGPWSRSGDRKPPKDAAWNGGWLLPSALQRPTGPRHAGSSCRKADVPSSLRARPRIDLA
jgi:hypothetical protein